VLVFEYPILAVLGIIQILKLVALNHFLEKEKALAIKSSYRNYYIYMASPAEVDFHPKNMDVWHKTQARLKRGLIQLALLLAMNFVITRFSSYNYHVSQLGFFGSGIIAGLQLSLCFQALTDLALSAFGYVFTDIYLEDVFNYPLLSSSPRDFWNKRWNLIIQKYVGKIMYMPLRGKLSKPMALVIIYLSVGLAHEFPMMFLPSAKFGYWTFIFVIHFFAMLTQFILEKSRIWTLCCSNAALLLTGRICTLILLACTAELAYSGFGLSVEGMAKDFNKIFFLR